MRRREFIALVGGAVAWPLPARAQPPGKLPTIGFLGVASAPVWKELTEAFVHRLRELGWVEDRTVTIEYRWAEGHSERYPALVAEFVRLKVDVIVTAGTAILAAKEATSTTPIVFALSNDPVSSGYVKSLARPGGNATGLSIQSTDLVGKRLELLRELIPGFRKLGILANVTNPSAIREMEEAAAVARILGVDVVPLAIRQADDTAAQFEGLRGRVDALYIGADPLLNASRVRIHALSMGQRLPVIYSSRGFAEGGGLISYGPNFADMFRRAGEIVDKILRGAKPSDIPVEQPTRFELVINLKTAEALGLSVPPSLIARADEVIE